MDDSTMRTEGSKQLAASDPAAIELESWIDAARRGDRESLGLALLAFRDYLLLVANEELDRALQAKAGASDLVQDTFVRAQRGLEGFRGGSVAEWRAWLRTILVRHLANQRRQYEATYKREVHREVSLTLGSRLDSVDDRDTPSRDLARRERQDALIAAISRLPEHYREVVIGHHREKLPFDEIGQRRGISADAARKLWARALSRLRKELGPAHDSR
jgi:RNA polymerase sigma-70 factor, ECF subfamily